MEETKVKITAFEVVDHGVDGAGYFPGCGVAFTNFEYVKTGTADTFAEAIEEALSFIADSPECDGVEFGAVRQAIANEGFGEVAADGNVTWMKSVSAIEEVKRLNGLTEEEVEEGALDECDVYYHVSIRYNTAAE